MKASVNTRYGPPEVLQIKDVIKPIPKDNEVLIKVRASTVNRTDTGFRDPAYLAVRVVGGFFKPKNPILGTELSGDVEEIGKDVKTFKIGDSVFGLKCFHFGAHAEYICVPEEGSIALKPQHISYEEAAASSEGPWFALTGLKKMQLKKGDKILINGGTGSIGSAAIQLAKYFGAEITAVANTKNLELVKSLGAHMVTDYTKQDFTKTLNPNSFDFIFDAVGKSSFFKCKKLLKPGGIYYSTELGYMSQNIFLALFTPLTGGKKVIFPIPKDKKEDILFFKKLIESGHYKAVIDRIYSLDQIVEATRYVETKEKTGNVVIKICSE
ncbi:NAD(P)-dependent alcohol dehydrogenase [Sphingobacteriaceae bacterium]|nr:NAD(P)-dependent alcohol dehydrogenase [Sphingobacteriaceae bacterium]